MGAVDCLMQNSTAACRILCGSTPWSRSVIGPLNPKPYSQHLSLAGRATAWEAARERRFCLAVPLVDRVGAKLRGECRRGGGAGVGGGGGALAPRPHTHGGAPGGDGRGGARPGRLHRGDATRGLLPPKIHPAAGRCSLLPLPPLSQLASFPACVGRRWD